jgi:hypothetical protein
MESPVTFKWKRGCPIKLFKANGAVTQYVKDKGNIAFGFVTHDVTAIRMVNFYYAV